MININESIIIEKPMAEVFTFTANQNNLPKWQKTVMAVEGAKDVLIKGSQFTVVRKFMGREVKATMDVLDYTPNSGFIFKSNGGPVNIQVKTSFESMGKSTKMTTDMQAEVGGFFKVADGLVGKQMKDQVIADEQVLKELLEKK
jgi:uncharacterized membrane protein